MDTHYLTNPTAEDEQSKEVYAHAGLALYWAQCFEKSLELFLLLHARLSLHRLTLAELDVLEEKLQQHTLGGLLRDFHKIISFEPSLDQVITTALTQRNFLAHRFFKERAGQFHTQGGRQTLVYELKSMQDALRTADSIAMTLCLALGHHFGITERTLSLELEKLREGVQCHGNDFDPCSGS